MHCDHIKISASPWCNDKNYQKNMSYRNSLRLRNPKITPTSIGELIFWNLLFGTSLYVLQTYVGYIASRDLRLITWQLPVSSNKPELAEPDQGCTNTGVSVLYWLQTKNYIGVLSLWSLDQHKGSEMGVLDLHFWVPILRTYKWQVTPKL